MGQRESSAPDRVSSALVLDNGQDLSLSLPWKSVLNNSGKNLFLQNRRDRV